MTKVFGIAAIGRSGQLGLGGSLPWHDPGDLRFFKSMTMGHRCIVGLKTYQKLPELPGRHLAVDMVSLTPEQNLEGYENQPVFIIGGAKTYERYRHLIRRWFVTMVDYDGPADTYMPALWASRPASEVPG